MAAGRVCALAWLVLASAPLSADVGTGTFLALAFVNKNCRVSTTPVAFGRYDPIGANKNSSLNASGAITVACVKGTAPTIALGQGESGAGTRRMQREAGGDFLVYELYQPPSSVPGIACQFPGMLVWGAAGTNLFAAASAPSRNPRSYSVCGSVPAGQNPTIGSYVDVVVATVSF